MSGFGEVHLPPELLSLIREKSRESVTDYLSEINFQVQDQNGKLVFTHMPAMLILATEVVTALVVIAHHEYKELGGKDTPIEQVTKTVLKTLNEVVPAYAKRGAAQMEKARSESKDAPQTTPTEGMEDPFDVVTKMMDKMKNDNN